MGGNTNGKGIAWNPSRKSVALNFYPRSISRNGQYACGAHNTTKGVSLYRKDLWGDGAEVQLHWPKKDFFEVDPSLDREDAAATTVNSSGTTLGYYVDWRTAILPPGDGVKYAKGSYAGSGFNFTTQENLDKLVSLVYSDSDSGRKWDKVGGAVFIPSQIADDGMAVGRFGTGDPWNSSIENGSFFAHVKTAAIRSSFPPIRGLLPEVHSGAWALNSASPRRGILGWYSSGITTGLKFWLLSADGSTVENSIARAPRGEVYSQGGSAYSINDRFQILGEFSHGGKSYSLVHNGMLTNPKPIDADWTVDYPQFINNSGVIAGYATNKKESGSRKALLVPAGMMADVNRDGKIDQADYGKITTDDPWRFWINDDDDSGDTGGDDIPNWIKDAADSGNGVNVPSPTVDGTRDLVDFFPVYLDIKSLLDILPPDKHTYKLKQADGALNFAYTDLDPKKCGDYLKKVDGSGDKPDNARALGGAKTIQITKGGIKLEEDWLKKIRDESLGVILIEGRKATSKPLVLEVSKGSTVLCQIPFYLKIDGVEEMFRHQNLLRDGGLRTSKPASRTGEPKNYPDNLTDGNKLVFVHGYNVNPEEARGWAAEMFKRFFWSGSRAGFCAVTWNGAESKGMLWIGGHGDVTPDFHINVAHALATAPAFASYLAGLSGEKTVVAHSLGNMVALSAISDSRASVKNFFMLDAAVAIEALDANADVNSTGDDGNENMVHKDWLIYRDYNGPYPNERFFASEWYHLFDNSTDARNSLTWRGRFGDTGRTALYNFFSSGEEVLGVHSKDTLPNWSDTAGDPASGRAEGQGAWALQEKLKGRGIGDDHPEVNLVGSTYGGWGFNSAYDYLKPQHKESRIKTSQLRAAPFFRTGVSGLDVALGRPSRLSRLYENTSRASEFAAANRDKLLADMIPARTLPLGGHPVKNTQIFPNGFQFDMQKTFKNEGQWPARKRPEWLHSDVKAVAYPYIWPLFDRIVKEGGLNK